MPTITLPHCYQKCQKLSRFCVEELLWVFLCSILGRHCWLSIGTGYKATWAEFYHSKPPQNNLLFLGNQAVEHLERIKNDIQPSYLGRICWFCVYRHAVTEELVQTGGRRWLGSLPAAILQAHLPVRACPNRQNT